MNINFTMVDKLLGAIPYPVGKAHLLQLAHDHGANEQIIGLLDKLPDITFNSADEIKQKFSVLGNVGNFFHKD